MRHIKTKPMCPCVRQESPPPPCPAMLAGALASPGTLQEHKNFLHTITRRPTINSYFQSTRMIFTAWPPWVNYSKEWSRSMLTHTSLHNSPKQDQPQNRLPRKFLCKLALLILGLHGQSLGDGFQLINIPAFGNGHGCQN